MDGTGLGPELLILVQLLHMTMLGRAVPPGRDRSSTILPSRECGVCHSQKTQWAMVAAALGL